MICMSRVSVYDRERGWEALGKRDPSATGLLMLRSWSVRRLFAPLRNFMVLVLQLFR